MHGDCGNITDGIHIPDLPEQFILGKYVVRVLRQKGEQIKFLGGKVLLHAVHIDTTGSFVDTNAANLHNIILRLGIHSHQSLISGQMRLHPCHQLTGAEGLCHIIICAQTQSANLVDVILSGRNHEDGHILCLSDLTAHLETIHPWQHQVQYDQIHIILQSHLQPFISRIADFHLKIGQLQIILLQISNCLLVFNNQNLAHKNTSQILIIGII